MKRLAPTVAFAWLVSACVLSARAQEGDLDWPQFRGPGGSGIADQQNPPIEIGPETNVKWKVAAPSGLSSPIVVGDMLVMTALEDEKLYTIAYSRADGSELWRVEAPAKELEPYHATEGSPAASTPATDGERIVSYFGSCGLFCYDVTGRELWKYEMPPASTAADFGTGVSPILADGKVVLLRDENNEPKIIALDAETGNLVWEESRQSTSGFSTPVLWKTSDGLQIAAAGYGRMVGYDLASGEEKWHVVGMPSACCASPVIAGENLFFAAWSPGDPEEAENPESQMPSYDSMLQGMDSDKDGKIGKDEAENTPLGGFFSAYDQDKDGYFTREEAEAIKQFLAASRNSAFALKPGGTGDITETHVLWKQKKGLPYVPTAIVYRGQQVMVKDGGIATAYNAQSGEQVYQKRLAATGSYYASPVAAAGRIYFTSLDDGTVTVIEAGGGAPKVLAKNPPFEERVAATPAIADDEMYVRTAGHLYAFAKGE